MENGEGRLSMSSDDAIDNIRFELLYDRIRSLNTVMPEEMFQEMKALSKDEWVQAWLDAGLTATKEDLEKVHDKMWPKGA